MIRRTRSSRRGFTLVEILIVVIILGILASIVVGQFANIRGSSSDAALKDNLRWMRSAVLLYQAEHGTFPTLTDFEGQMTQYTDKDGNVVATKDATHRFGAYILSLPPLPVGAQKGQTAVTGMTYAANFGWQYDQTTGGLRANCADSEVDFEGVQYNSY